MSTEEFVDHLFGIATGWLGWSPKVALSTPLPQIYLATRARIKWLAMCNGQASDEDPVEHLKSQFRKLSL